MEKSLELRDISKSFRETKVLDQMSLSIPKGETTCLLGPSGCGKTTLLRIIAGIIQPDQGTLTNFKDKSFSFVFQEDRLLPWKTAADNIRLVLKNKMHDTIINDIIDKHLDLVKMKDYAGYYPHQLSGGMRQRISFARAFSFPSDVILLDEPFKGLDHALKQQLMENVRSILSNDPRTVIYVTHDPEEAAFFGKKIIVMCDKPARIIKEIVRTEEKDDDTSCLHELSENIKRILNEGKK
jgi:NitT/TauT family transport system ATP-binding protein